MCNKEDGNAGGGIAIKKSEIIFQLFCPGHPNTRFRVGGIVSVLLLVTGQSVIFATEGCRRDLSGASGQTAL